MSDCKHKKVETVLGLDSYIFCHCKDCCTEVETLELDEVCAENPTFGEQLLTFTKLWLEAEAGESICIVVNKTCEK